MKHFFSTGAFSRIFGLSCLFFLPACQTIEPQNNGQFVENYTPKPFPSTEFYNVSPNSNGYEKKYDSANSIALSPDGKNIVLWYAQFQKTPFQLMPYSQPYWFHLFDAVCLRKIKDFDKCQRESISAPGTGITHINWSEDSKNVYFIDFSFSLNQGQLDKTRTKFLISKEKVKIQENWEYRHSYSAFGATKSGNFQEELARIRAANAQIDRFYKEGMGEAKFSKLRTSLDFDGMVGINAENKNNLNVGLITDGGSKYLETDFISPEILGSQHGNLSKSAAGKIVRDSNGNPYILGFGSVNKINSKSGELIWSDGKHFFESPILTSKGGKIIGKFSEQNIVFFEGSNLGEKLQNSIEKSLGKNEIISQIAVSDDLKSCVIISNDVSVGTIYKFYYYEPFQNKFSVVSKTFENKIAIKDLVLDIKDIGERGWPLQARHYSRPNSKNLIVYLYGGPHSVLAGDAHWNGATYEILSRNHDALIIGYSGSTNGLETVSRLRKNGYKALEKDAMFLGRYLKTQDSKYDKIFLIAESFGGAIAPILIKEFPEIFHKSVLISPLAKIKRGKFKTMAPSGNAELDAYFAVAAKENKRAQDLFLTRAFAGENDDAPNSFANWLKDRYENLNPNENVMIIQGEDDEKSLPDDIPVSGKAIRIVNKRGHSGFNEYLGKDSILEKWLFEDQDFRPPNQ